MDADAPTRARSAGRRRRDAKASRARLEAAGERLFAERGYDGVTVAMISREARLNRRMIYHYFGDKEGLYRAVIARAYERLSAMEADLAASDAPAEELIERMVRDLNMPVEIVSCPTVREPDGLALSSRNQYLTPQQRQAAPAIYRALQKAAGAVRAGATAAYAEQIMREQLQAQPQLRVQYARALHPYTLQEPTHAGPPMLLAVAAFAGDTRLIDNIVVVRD